MSWLFFTLLAYLVNAFAFIVDKYLLSSHISKPFVYAFWVAVLSIAAVALIPFGVEMQNASFLLIALASGSSFFIGLIFLYKAIKASDISVASTTAGAATAVFSYILAIPILNESADVLNFSAIIMLIIGMVFLGRIDRSIWRLAIWAGVFFGISFVFLKLSFDLSDFVNGIFWTRVSFVGAALLSLVFSSARSEVLSFRNIRPRVRAMFIGNKILAAAGFLLLYYAIRLGQVSIVNSLLGFQFLFIFILAVFLRTKVPGIEENFERHHIIHKLVGIGFVVTGFLATVWTS